MSNDFALNAIPLMMPHDTVEPRHEITHRQALPLPAAEEIATQETAKSAVKKVSITNRLKQGVAKASIVALGIVSPIPNMLTVVVGTAKKGAFGTETDIVKTDNFYKPGHAIFPDDIFPFDVKAKPVDNAMCQPVMDVTCPDTVVTSIKKTGKFYHTTDHALIPNNNLLPFNITFLPPENQQPPFTYPQHAVPSMRHRRAASNNDKKHQGIVAELNHTPVDNQTDSFVAKIDTSKSAGNALKRG